MNDCHSAGFINDARYAESLVRGHIARGHGPIRIRQAIAQKGLSKECIDTAITNSGCDWFELAKNKAIKKYGIPSISGINVSHSRELFTKEKAKQVRFLLNQGFNYEQITYALDCELDENMSE